MSIYTSFHPTYLYIKQHAITGKLYFGKTIRNPETYLGSGKRWKRHIKKHGTEHVVTLWYCLFHDSIELSKFALSCSELWNIVESEDWLNLQPENGLDGASPGHTGYIPSAETLSKISRAASRRVHSVETKAKISNARKGKPLTIVHTLECPHCGKQGRTNMMYRWHFANCKSIVVAEIVS